MKPHQSAKKLLYCPKYYQNIGQMQKMIRILRTSSREKDDLLAGRILELQAAGFDVLYDDQSSDPNWAYSAASASDRAAALFAALQESETSAVMTARGGYGASDLLHLLDWTKLTGLREKILIGFSDTSALHSALYTLCGWRGIHGPMPGTALWNRNGVTADTARLLSLIRCIENGISTGSDARGEITIEPVLGRLPAKVNAPGDLTGKLFGGCFSVLTNLIGTPYLPKSLSRHILFFEDLDEHPGRLMRHWNQWLQSGILDGVTAIVVGNLLKLGQNIPDNAPFVYEEWASRCPVPLFKSTAFGHLSPNFPLGIGADATLSTAKPEQSKQSTIWSLKWNFAKDQRSTS